MRKILCQMFVGSLLFFLLGTALAKDPITPKKTPELLIQGKKLYDQNCALCHGAKGDGKGAAGLALKPPPRTFNLPLSQWTYSKGNLNKVFEVITKGIPNTSMVKWDHLSEQERWALVYYVVEFAARKVPPKKK